jgi:hypothetical protein
MSSPHHENGNNGGVLSSLRHEHGNNGGILSYPHDMLAVNGGVAKVSMPTFKRAHPMLVPSLRSQPLLKAPACDSAPAARPILSSPAAELRINGRCPLSLTH